MSKTVMIPNDTRPTWSCEINGARYAYAAGTEQTVPDEVAALIEANAANVVPENPPETVEETAKRISDEEIGKTFPDAPYAAGVTVLTTAPTADNEGEGHIIVILDEEPEVKYDGYIYLIKESQS